MDATLTLRSYVPPFVQWRMARDPTAPLGPFQDVYRAAVIHVDLTGFTALAEEFASQGVAGAEQVCNTLGVFFRQLGAIVGAHDGHTVLFAGDAATVMWPVEAPEQLSGAVRHAVRCCGALRDSLNARQRPDGTPRLGIHLSVGAGEVLAAGVGGIEGRWLPAVHGTAVDQAWRAQRHATVGQILVSPEAWAHLGADFSGETRADGTVVLTGSEDHRPHSLFDFTRPPLLSNVDVRAYVCLLYTSPSPRD